MTEDGEAVVAFAEAPERGAEGKYGAVCTGVTVREEGEVVGSVFGDSLGQRVWI